MWRAIAIALALSLAAPQALSAQPPGTVSFVNETGEEVGLQISGSAVSVGGQRYMTIKPRHSAALPVAPGAQQLRVWTIQRVSSSSTAVTSGSAFEKLVAVRAGAVVRIGDEDFRSSSGAQAAGARNLTYEGYSKQFVPLKRLLLQDQSEEIGRIYAEGERKVRESCDGKIECFVARTGFLGLVEKGTLSLDLGEFDQSVQDLEGAELFLTLANNESKVKEWFRKGYGFVLETITGHEEFGPYYGEGFERVLMLNYKSMAYMLKGDRKAYNVTRRAIDWQNMERRQFEEKLREVEKEIGDKEKELKEEANGQDRDYSGQVRAAYAETDAKASSVASAYVNPFGFYLAGVIQELEGRQDPSLISSALISYRKALELNPRSPAIQEAVRQLEQGKPPEGKLVHVIVNDGFAPEKMVLTHHLRAGTSRRTGRQLLVPIKLPYYEPAPNKVERITVETKDGERLAELSRVADVEAIALRHQKDLLPFIYLRVGLSALRNTFWEALRDSGPIFDAFGKIMQKVSAPDTRAWMTLPATIQATRLHVPRQLGAIVIASYDGSGTRLARQIATLHGIGATFVYGRSLDDKLVVHASRDLWVNGNPGRSSVVSR
jgi:uncharacterized protein